jgi:hypothetical protein
MEMGVQQRREHRPQAASMDRRPLQTRW